MKPFRFPSICSTKALIRSLLLILFALHISPVYADDATDSNTLVGDAIRGKAIFDTTCKHCHHTNYDESSVGAPGLQGVLERHDEAWLHAWIKGPETFAKIDATAKTLLESNKFGLIMPTLPTAQDDQKRTDIIAYLKTLK